MNSRLSLLATGIKNIACACTPILRPYRVSYFDRTYNEEIKMYESKWTQVEVEAYSNLDAATRVKPELKPGFNCFATRIFRRET